MLNQSGIEVFDTVSLDTVSLRDKFQWSGYMLHDMREKLRGLGNLVSPTEALGVIKEDPDDNRILECAMTAKSDYIVTEDKDLLRLVTYGNVRILTIRDFIDQALAAALRR